VSDPATKDALFGGRLVLFQPARGSGYRTNVDALLLASFAAPSRPVDVAFDLGAGVGAVGLSLLKLGAAKTLVLVEANGPAAKLAERNLEANGWADRGEVVHADVREVAVGRRGEASLVVCNPPYIAPGRGRVAQGEEHARMGELAVFVAAARQVAGKKARVCLVYPAQELGTLLETLATAGLHAKRLRMVHATRASPARVVLVEARAGRAGGLEVGPAFIERDGEAYTDEMRAVLDGTAGARPD
jgi:tRNA1Val (adenine37-N6)-methyltransferase